MKIKLNSYTAFLQSVKKDQAPEWPSQAKDIIEHFSPLHQRTSHFAPTTFLLDYSTRRYIHVDASCFDLLGYKAGYFMERGLEDYISKWHPDDFYVLDQLIIPVNISFLQSIDPNDYIQYIFSYNYRLLNAAEEYMTVLQRFSYIPGNGSLPAGVVGVIFDISHYKSDSSIVHTIEKTSICNNESLNELVYKKVHPVFAHRKSTLLSKKELQTLNYIAQALSSKQVAHKLGISVNTVSNHRRNMLAKTACRSSSELINYAIKHGFLIGD